MYRVETKAKSRIDKKSLGQMTDYLNLAGLRKHPVITHTLHFRKGRKRKVCIKTLLNQHQVNSSAFTVTTPFSLTQGFQVLRLESTL